MVDNVQVLWKKGFRLTPQAQVMISFQNWPIQATMLEARRGVSALYFYTKIFRIRFFITPASNGLSRMADIPI